MLDPLGVQKRRFCSPSFFIAVVVLVITCNARWAAASCELGNLGLYNDFQVLSPESDGSVPLHATATANIHDDECEVEAAVWIKDPSNYTLAYSADSAYGSVSVDVYHYVTDSSAEGNYTSVSQGWAGGNGPACSGTSTIGINYGTMTYNNVGHNVNNTEGYYVRCNSGTVCTSITVPYLAVVGWNGTFPSYAAILVITATVGPVRSCFGVSAQARPNCQPDAKSLGYLLPNQEGMVLSAANASVCRVPSS